MARRYYRRPIARPAEKPLPAYVIAEGPAPERGGSYKTIASKGWNDREQCYVFNLIETGTGGVYLMTATFCGWQFQPVILVEA